MFTDIYKRIILILKLSRKQTHTKMLIHLVYRYLVSVDSAPEGNVYLYVCDFRPLKCPYQNACLQTYGYHTRGLKGLRVGDYTYFAFTFLTVHSAFGVECGSDDCGHKDGWTMSAFKYYICIPILLGF